jgi:hypothetical protein
MTGANLVHTQGEITKVIQGRRCTGSVVPGSQLEACEISMTQRMHKMHKRNQCQAGSRQAVAATLILVCDA